jgi:MFS transporter, FSR family, fosmidomycin resistance protein
MTCRAVGRDRPILLNTTESTPPGPRANKGGVYFGILVAISCGHLLNDTLQSLIAASYPMFRAALGLTYAQLGTITLVFQGIAAVLQPAVGMILDRRPAPGVLPCGMVSSLLGILVLSAATSFPAVLLGAALVGFGSAIFHPEASRIAHLAAGRRRGLAQSLFQVGGNAGTSLGPLFASVVVAARGRESLAWFSGLGAAGVYLLMRVAAWHRSKLAGERSKAAGAAGARGDLSDSRTLRGLATLAVLIFSKYFYLASMGNFYTFYLMDRFGLTASRSQFFLFIFLASVAAGTVAGGPIGDRFGRRRVIWISILGVAPFTLALPHVGLGGAVALSVVIGLVLSSAFSAILVYAQELAPGRVGFVSGLFFGLAFGMGGAGSAILGFVADKTSIGFMFRVCSFLPLLGALALTLPEAGRQSAPGSGEDGGKTGGTKNSTTPANGDIQKA